jgi:hypothetical protein
MHNAYFFHQPTQITSSRREKRAAWITQEGEMMETTYDFEELKISEFGVGALLYGQALLKSDSNGGWFVDEIVFQNGHVIHQGSPTVLDREMFKAITEVLYDDRIPADGSLTHGCLAASEWADAVSDRRAA